MTVSRAIAFELQAAGLEWNPASGDRFTLRIPTFAGETFTIADMTVEPQGAPGARVLGFNGTPEWALDSVQIDDTVWLPREDQLRELLGSAFVELLRIPTGFAVTIELPSGPHTVTDPAATDAYGRALLALLGAGGTVAAMP